MRLLNRHADEDDAGQSDEAAVEPTAPQPVVTPEGDPDRWSDRFRRRTVTVPMTVPRSSVRRTMTVPTRRLATTTRPAPRWGLPSLVAVLAGGALAVVGIVALVRTGVDSSWYAPHTTVLDADHTPLLGLVEAGAGVLVLLLGLLGNRYLVAMAGIAGALVATAAAVEPEPLQRELAIESWWAWVLAGAGVLLTLVALQAPTTRPATVIDVP